MVTLVMNVTEILCDLAKTMKVDFVLQDKPIAHQDVFAEDGLLPAMAKRADQLSSLCLGYGIGTDFVEADDSVLGLRVQFDDATPNVLRMLFFYEVLTGLIDASLEEDSVELDELLYD